MIFLIALLAQLVVSQPNPYQVVVTMGTPTASAVPTATPTPASATDDANAVDNLNIPTSAELATFAASNPVPEVSNGANYWPKVNGQFPDRSTRAILAWGAAKWNFSLPLVEAIADVESGWLEGAHGDLEHDSSLPGFATCACPNGGSWGIMQVAKCGKVDLPSTCSAEGWDQTYPLSATSTAFNVDFKLAYMRACMDGNIAYLKSDTPTAGHLAYAAAVAQPTSNDLLYGCVGQWSSGGWWDADAIKYVNQVQAAMTSLPWLRPGF
jgi:hypothetical protein